MPIERRFRGEPLFPEHVGGERAQIPRGGTPTPSVSRRGEVIQTKEEFIKETVLEMVLGRTSDERTKKILDDKIEEMSKAGVPAGDLIYNIFTLEEVLGHLNFEEERKRKAFVEAIRKIKNFLDYGKDGDVLFERAFRLVDQIRNIPLGENQKRELLNKIKPILIPWYSKKHYDETIKRYSEKPPKDPKIKYIVAIIRLAFGKRKETVKKEEMEERIKQVEDSLNRFFPLNQLPG